MAPAPHSSEPAPEPAPSGSRNGTDGLSLRELGAALRQRLGLFAGLAAGVVILVMGLTLLIPPVYQSEGLLRVQADRSEGLGGGMLSGITEGLPVGLGLPGLMDADVQTEIGVLGSRRIVEEVADSLALHVSLKRPARAFRTEVLPVVEAGPDAPEGTYTLRRRGDGSYAVSARGTDRPVALPERVAIGERFSIGPMTFQLSSALADDPPRTVRIRVDPFRRTIRTLRRDLRLQREDAGSRLIEIRYRHPDPHLGQALVNGTMERFLEYSESVSLGQSARKVEVLGEQVALYASALADAEARLQAYQEQERIVHPDEQTTQQVRRLAEMQVHHDALSVERQALAEFVEAVTAPASTDGGEVPFRRLAGFPTFLQNAAVQEFLNALIELENLRSELLVQRTEENVDVRMVRERVRELEEQIRTLTGDYLQGLDTQLASSGRTLEQFGDELDDLPRIEVEYTRRLRERRLLSEVYVTLQARLAEARVQQAVDEAAIRIVDEAVIDDRPAFPRPAISLALSLVLGMMVGLFGVVAAESASPFVRSRRDVGGAIGAPVLGAVPGFGGRAGRGGALVVRDRSGHRAAEALQGVALAVRGREDDPGVILVAGADRGEGRSVVAANLALALARQGLTTALLDADLRHGSLARVFGVTEEPGWVQGALRGAEATEAAREIDTGSPDAASLRLYPAGRSALQPLEILSSGRLAGFLEELRDRHDTVVIDTPALAVGHDAAALAPLTDGVVLVARAGRTGRNELVAAADELRRAGGRIVGSVLTDA